MYRKFPNWHFTTLVILICENVWYIFITYPGILRIKFFTKIGHSALTVSWYHGYGGINFTLWGETYSSHYKKNNRAFIWTEYQIKIYSQGVTDMLKNIAGVFNGFDALN